MYRLLSATPSPYARKVRVALLEKGVPFELVTEIPWHDGALTETLNPLQKLPVLIPDEGEPVYESSLILEVLELCHPDPPLFPIDPVARLQARRFEVLGDGICDAVVLILLERMRAADKQSAPWLARQMRKVQGGLAELARLAPPRPPLVGDRFGLADIAVGCTLGYLGLRLPELDWQATHPALVPLHEAWEARPSFAETVPVRQPIDAAVVI
ncbi:MAG: glutathione S-transferase N-terminal domain-containing protein [Sneathiellaceae bacterium]